MDPSPDSALERLLAEERWLRALGRRLVRDAAAGDDLVQETWLHALRSGGPRAASPGGARRWLAQVLRNAWRQRSRGEAARCARERRVAAREALPSAHEALERLEVRQRLAAHVLALDEPFRSTLVMRYVLGRSAAELAAEAGEPASRVRQRLARARALLRERLDRDGDAWVPRFALWLGPLRPSPGPAAPVGTFALPRANHAPVGLAFVAMSTKSLALCAAVCAALFLALRAAQRETPRSPATSAARPESAATGAADGAALVAPRAGDPAVAPGRLDTLRDAVAHGELRADAPARLHGQVRASEDGRPLVGVDVALLQGGFSAPALTTTSDAAGRFAFTDVPSGRFSLAGRVEGRVPRTVPDVDLSAGADVALDLVLERGFSPVIEVFDLATAAPVAGAEVQLVAGTVDQVTWLAASSYPFHGLACTTDAAGRASPFGVAPGVYQTIVRAEGYPNALGEALLVPDEPPLRIALDRGGVVTGVVRDARGAPVASARVFLVAAHHQRRLESHVLAEDGVATDDEGRYRIARVPRGVYRAVALRADGSGAFHLDAGDGARRPLAQLYVDRGAEVALDFTLPEPGRVSGQVVDEAGRPVAGARVTVSWGDFKAPGASYFALARVPGQKESIHHDTVTDEDGRFTLAPLRLSHRPLEIDVKCPGYVAAELALDVPAGARPEERVVLRALGAVIQGRVVDGEGAPLAGRSVSAFEAQGAELGDHFLAITAADGSYELRVPARGKRGGRYRVEPFVRSDEGLTATPARVEDVAVGARGVDFVLTSRTTLEGLVVDERGERVRDFVVHVARPRGPGLFGKEDTPWAELRDVRAGEGRFRVYVDGLEVELCWSAPGHDSTFVRAAEVAAEGQVVLPRARDLTGVVVDADGAAVADAVVALATLDSAIYPARTGFAPRAVTNAAGRFVLAGVPASSTAGPRRPRGQLLVCATGADAPPLVRAPLPDDRSEEMRIVLPRTRPTTLAFVRADGTPARGFALLLDADGWPLEPALEVHLAHLESEHRGWLRDGRARFALAPGPYSVILVEGADVRGRHEFTVDAGGLDDSSHSFVVP